MSEHEHTPNCADRSRFTIVRLSIVSLPNGANDVRLGVKPSAMCWSDLATVKVGRVWLGDDLPRGLEEALDRGVGVLDALRADIRWS
jgi:hypothetical protein